MFVLIGFFSTCLVFSHFPGRLASERSSRLNLIRDANTVDVFASYRKYPEVPPPLKVPLLSAPLRSLREILAFNVRTFRVLRGLSQERLGFEAELDRTFISQVERARTNVSIDNVEKLAKCLDVDPSLLFIRPLQASGLDCVMKPV